MSQSSEYLVIGLVFFALFAWSRRSPQARSPRPAEILTEWLAIYAGLFVTFYLYARFFSVDLLVDAGQLSDAWLWSMTTAAWLGTFAGSHFGALVRRVTRVRTADGED